mmetsp:Transcript_762/g.2030  ORF Transcript_762/g.2030 Transcript_762/m.2030 type:complete len:251 (-) Transcript_762:812-1564(-)
MEGEGAARAVARVSPGGERGGARRAPVPGPRARPPFAQQRPLERRRRRDGRRSRPPSRLRRDRVKGGQLRQRGDLFPEARVLLRYGGARRGVAVAFAEPPAQDRRERVFPRRGRQPQAGGAPSRRPQHRVFLRSLARSLASSAFLQHPAELPLVGVVLEVDGHGGIDGFQDAVAGLGALDQRGDREEPLGAVLSPSPTAAPAGGSAPAKIVPIPLEQQRQPHLQHEGGGSRGGGGLGRLERSRRLRHRQG